ncbi:MAG: hypothetical protein WEC82_00390 [Xanthobacteraceae bacterium]
MEIKALAGRQGDKALSRGAGRSLDAAREDAHVHRTDQVISMASASGHKTSQHLIEAEAYRRIMAGELPESFDEFAGQLLAWLQQTHPGASPITQNIIEDQIREIWHRRHELIRGG